jgi:hypothetical protein
MSKYHLTCFYCNTKWEQDWIDKKNLQCKNYKDKRVLIDLEQEKVDYYSKNIKKED